MNVDGSTGLGQAGGAEYGRAQAASVRHDVEAGPVRSPSAQELLDEQLAGHREKYGRIAEERRMRALQMYRDAARNLGGGNGGQRLPGGRLSAEVSASAPLPPPADDGRGPRVVASSVKQLEQAADKPLSNGSAVRRFTLRGVMSHVASILLPFPMQKHV
jgi:hypothetical protein